MPTRYESVGCDDGNFSFPKEFQISQRAKPKFDEVKDESANANPFMNFCNLKKGYSREGRTAEKGVFIGTFHNKG